jgi:quercetin dioxygenase-like cupin family protein
MRIERLIITATVCCLYGASALRAQEPAAGITDAGPDHHLVYSPADVEWQAGPGSFEPGAEFTVLEGDPSEPGVFTMRIRMPDGFVIAPHWHPNVERVTVLSGTFHLGSGERLDRSAARALEVGSYFSLPPRTPHYAITEGETVIQLTSVGPWQINYVDAGDDPRRRN